MAFAIVVSGLPASGKSTLAKDLGPWLHVPCIDKDDHLEALFDQRPVQSLDDRSRLSRDSDDAFIAACRAAGSAILVSHWRPSGPSTQTGTPTDWLGNAYDTLLEVSCVCSAATAQTRFLSRKRHPGHLDAMRDAEALRLQFEELLDGYPLKLGETVRVDAEKPVDAQRVAQELMRISPAVAAHVRSARCSPTVDQHP